MEKPEFEETMKGDREKILARIREALVVPTPEPHEGPGHSGGQGNSFRGWLPPVGDAVREQVSLFAKQSEVLKTQFVECDSLEAVASRLVEIGRENGWRRLAWHPGVLNTPLVEALVRAAAGLDLVQIDAGYDPDALEACDAGVTECEVLVAQTGSVMVSALSSGGRALSVLPHHHVVVARRSQMVADLAEAYEQVEKRYAGRLPSFLSFISGPSRTGDIERILVLGAHGPKKLTVFLVADT